MSIAFADTFYWVALANPRDQWHAKSSSICVELSINHIVTSDEVLIEFLTQMGNLGVRMRRKAVDLVGAIRTDPAILVLPQSRDSFEAGLALYRARTDKSYSMVDCISMAAMHARKLSRVLTHDEHFAQEGFRALFRD